MRYAEERTLAGCVQEVVLPAAAAALPRGGADVGADHAFRLEAIQRDVHRARRDVASGPRDDFTMNRGAERAVPEAQQSDEHELLELPTTAPAFADAIRVTMYSE